MAHLPHCNVGEKDKRHQSPLEKPVIPCSGLEWPLLCTLPALRVSSEESTISLGSPSNSLSITAFSGQGDMFFAAVFGQMVPWGHSPRLIPIMSNYVWATEL